MTYASDTFPNEIRSKIQGDTFRAMTPANQPRTRILVADDQPDIREALRLLLKGEGFEIETVASPAAVIVCARSPRVRRASDGLELRARHHVRPGGPRLAFQYPRQRQHAPVIVMTAWGSLELAVEAMRRGAKDFVQKPWENARLLAILRTQIELSQALCARASASKRKIVCCAPMAARRHDCRIRRDASRNGLDRARGPFGCQRFDHRRTRHGQGSGRAHALCALASRRTSARHRKCRGPARRRF